MKSKTPEIQVQPATHKDLASICRMAHLLWPEESESDLQNDIRGLLTVDNHQFWIANDEDTAVGFIMASLRIDYVEGADDSPTGYVEGIYVEKAYRNRGIGRELISKAERWAASRGCTQMGSDTWEWHQASRDFHKSIGFREEDVLVHFLKEIDPANKGATTNDP